MPGIGVRVPTFNQIITLAATMAALLFVLRFFPENIKSFFRV